MAITDKEQGVWELDEVYNKQMEGGIWSYDGLGELFNWGKNGYGQLGLNSIGSPANEGRSSPTQIPGTTWTTLSRGAGGTSSNFGMAVKSDGTLWTWGFNEDGPLGQNNLASYSSPTQIPGTTWSQDPNKVEKNKGMSVIKTDGTLWSWGYSSQGQAGDNEDLLRYSSPVQCPGTTWSKLGSSATTRHAIKTDGTLWSWGGNQYGQQGLNDRTSRSSPIQLPGTTWNDVSGGLVVAIATKTDGTLWSWGGRNDNSDSYGILGQNNQTQYSSPVQIGTDTTWSTGDLKITAGKSMMGAIKTDGTLWVWGRNLSACLGQNDGTSAVSSPIQVGTDTTWNKLCSCEGAKVYAIKTDGTMWAWGDGSSGSLGQGQGITVSSPKQIGTGTNWLQVSGGINVGRAIRLL